MIRTSKCEIYTIFSKYLTIPVATFPKSNELGRLRSDIYFLDKKVLYQLSY